MKFSIITPTYKRPDKLIIAFESVLKQDHRDWEMIIVNDSPDHDYSSFEEFLEKNKERLNNRIKYFKNEKNMGVNYSRNFALANMTEDSDYFIFLDDDDWLDPNCLTQAVKQINSNREFYWFVSNRLNVSENIKITENKTGRKVINYLSDWLIFKRFSGDATNIISKEYKNKRFSSIKNAEEWIFYAQLPKEFYYYDYNSSYSEGYDNSGITQTYKNRMEKIKNTSTLFWECIEFKILSPKILLYFFLRVGAIILK